MILGVKTGTILRLFIGIGSLLLSCGAAYALVPAAPTNLVATPVSASQINLRWTDNSNNETSFKVERKIGSGGTYSQIATAGTNVTTFSNTGLTAGTTYFYRVRASNSSGNSAYTNEASAVPVADTTAPTAPTGLTTTAVASNQIDLNWTASTDNVGVTGYRVERCLGASCTDFAEVAAPAGTSLSDGVTGGVSGAMTYRYRVRAADAAGNLSGYSTVTSATTPKGAWDTIPPTAPHNLLATAASGHQVNLSWGASRDDGDNPESGDTLAGYLVERCQGANCASFSQLGFAGGTGFSDMALTETTIYSYRVRAFDLAGNLSTHSNVASATTQASNAPSDTTAPTVPSGLSAVGSSNATTNAIYLTWNPSSDNFAVTAYRVERCQGVNCAAFAEIATLSGTSINDVAGLTAGTSYSYRVRAGDAAGNLSPYSNVASASPQVDTTPPSPPTVLTGVAVGPNQINLSWTASSDNVAVSRYQVQSCQGAGCTNFASLTGGVWGSRGFLTPTSYAAYPLAEGTSYSYRVRAVDVVGNLSDFSSVMTLTTPNQDTTPPTPPTGLALTVAGQNRVNLSWTASTDNIGVELYRVERCQGIGCTDFIEVASPSAAGMSDYGLASNLSYSYRVRAEDVAGNRSAYSNVASTSVSIDIVPTGQGSGGGVNVTALTLTQGSSGSLSVTISPVQATNTAVSITTSAPGVASAPASVVIPAGSASAVLVVTAIAPGSADITASFLGASSTAQVIVNPALGASVDSSVNGSVVAGSNESISGTFSGPSNTGITVNGVVAAIVGNTFVVPDIPLQPGANTLTIVLTTPTGQTTTSTISVNSTGPAPMEVTASPAQGTAPLAVVFTVNNRTHNAIQSVQADYLGTGSFVTVGPNALSNNYTVPGVYQAKFIITDGTGATFQRTVPIAVQDPVQIDQMLQASWSGFTATLASQSTAQSLRSLNAQAQAKYAPVFSALQADLPQIVASFSAPQLVSVSGETGEYLVTRTINGATQAFFVYFLRDRDGVWRIDSM